jgi:hypothetical protein
MLDTKRRKRLFRLDTTLKVHIEVHCVQVQFDHHHGYYLKFHYFVKRKTRKLFTFSFYYSIAFVLFPVVVHIIIHIGKNKSKKKKNKKNYKRLISNYIYLLYSHTTAKHIQQEVVD